MCLYLPASGFQTLSQLRFDCVWLYPEKGVFLEDGTPILVPGSFGILGLNFTPMYNFSRYFRAGVSLDAQYDESANISRHIANSVTTPDAETIKFYRPPFREQFAVGLSLRAEIVMPIFRLIWVSGEMSFVRGPTPMHFIRYWP